ncbi:MAG: S8 family serine peptidase [Anaerolineae bacterium]|nr:S8 family serine peptidase [Anaerolineae bacterium]
MNYHRRRVLMHLMTAVTIFSLLFNLVLPAIDFTAQAQEATEEAPAPTEETPQAAVETTDEPPAPTQETTAEPTIVVPTAESTAEVPTSVPTEAPTATNTPPPAITVFTDNLQDGNADGWQLTPGWQIGVEGENLFLTTSAPGEIATIANLLTSDFSFAAQIRLDAGNIANIHFRAGVESYKLALDAMGNATLFRNADIAAIGSALPFPSDGTFTPLWHAVKIDALGGQIIVTVDGAQQIIYVDAVPLPAGAIFFSTEPTNSGAVSIDQLLVTQPDLMVPVPVVTTPPPTETPSPEATTETTPEATAETTAEPTAEITPEAITNPGTLVLSADFEAETTAWLPSEGASVVLESETNHALLMAASSSLFPAQPIFLADFSLDARLNILSDAGDGSPTGLSIPFRTSTSEETGAISGYVLTIDPLQTALYRNGSDGLQLLISSPTAHALNIWHSLSLSAQGGQIIVTVNGVVELDYTDAEPLLNGQIAFVANAGSSLMLDDIAVTDFSMMIPITPTAIPFTLTDAERAKLPENLVAALELALGGDAEGALAFAKASFIPLDEEARVYVVLWAQENGTGAALAPMVEAVGGVIDSVNEFSVDARVPLSSLIALVNVADIHSIRLSSMAISTSSTLNAPPTGAAVSEGYDVVGANDWNNMGITGTGQRIAVIDTGYGGLSTSAAGEKTCLQQSPATVGTGDHGTRVIQVICDIAPNADVYAYTASTTATMLTALNTARNTANASIILITMDLGANAAPGDGTDGDTTAYNGALATQPSVYDAIRKAKEEGRLVIVSAGNNFGKYASFNYAAGTTDITINAAVGDKVNISWNDWNSAPNGGATRDDLNFDPFPEATADYPGRVVNGPPSHQFVLDTACAPCTLSITGKIGDAASLYVQVQVTGNGDLGVSGSATGINTTSSIGRPGDAPEALTVGAVCASTESIIGGYFSPLTDSSRGPIFSNGGAAPGGGSPTARTGYKPNLVGPSHVSTSFDVNVANSDPGIDDFCNTPGLTDGFNGTSAAAAHVAGMAALIRSNTNANIAIAPVGSTPQQIRQNVEDYLQSHTIDLHLANGGVPDGFDMTYGAGLTTLGSPAPASPISTDHNALSNVTCSGGSSVYVSGYSLSTDERVLDGTLGSRDNPYIHMGQALAEAPANACVVVLPGEYVGGIFLDNTTLPNNNLKLQSYQFTFPTAADTTIWANNGLATAAAIGFGSGDFPPTRSFTLRGFKFLRANPLGQRFDAGTGLSYPPNDFNPVSAVNISNSTGAVVLDKNDFTLFDDNNANTFPSNFEPPVLVESSSNVSIQNSLFYGNAGKALGVLISNSGSGTSIAVTVQYNTFRDNIYQELSNVDDLAALIRVVNSTANIISNRFTANSTESIIFVQNLNEGNTFPFGDAEEVNVLGNAIFSNANSRAIVKLGSSHRFRFSNNTVANNTLMNTGTNIIERGRSDIATSNDGLLEINNNVFYDNASVLAIYEDVNVNTVCYNFAGTANEGAKNNWSDDTVGDQGDCVNSLSGFNNRINDETVPMGTLDTDDSVFVGTSIAPDDPYQLAGDAIYGLDVPGSNAFVPASFTAVGSLDAVKKKRVDPSVIDLGAYEYITVAATPIVQNINEDDPPLALDMNASVIGGFAPYTFLLLTPPANYSTDPSNLCGGQAIKQEFVEQTKQTVFTYCPPADFYTVGAPAGSTATFMFQIRDASGGLSDPTPATININPVDDEPLTTPISYNVVVEGHEGPGTRNVTFRLRPYARFNNYRIVRPNDESDYPYDYTFGAQTATPGQNNGMFTNLAAGVSGADATGLAMLTLNPNEVGFVEFTYTAIDDNGNDSVNTAKVTVVGSLPDTGLHDNTSFAFLYRGATEADQGFWAPVYSEININNTLHTTVTLNDTAEFLFNGAAFALYMQGSTAGGSWELQVDNGGTLVRLPWNGAQVITQSGITCRTSALTGKATATLPDLKYYISNLGGIPYVVSCSGLIEGEPNTIRIINRAARNLSIDAVGIYNDDLPLLPGAHEVTETQLVPLFLQGWAQITDVRATARKAVAFSNLNGTTLPGIVSFRFRGTGFALGTSLETNTLKQGAQYRICVANVLTPDNDLCQTFNNGLGATTIPVFNIYRPFFGFDPVQEYQVTVEVTTLPARARMVIDSIIVFDQEPTDTLPFGTTEDDKLGPIVFNNALPDTWILDTNNVRTSNRSLTSIISTVPKAGPFISFQIPTSADVIIWKRFATTLDSTNLMVCVDRAQFETLTNVCKEYNLRLAGNNPLTIKESDFVGGWGTGFGAPAAHTVEIFSLTNFPFNVDSIQVLDSTAALVAGNYEQTVPNLKFFNDDDPTYSFTGSSFITVASTAASGGNYARTVEQNEGIFFRFTGTGFSTLFALDRYASNVKFCWLEDVGATATVATVLASPTCQTISNVGTAILNQIARTFVGLENSTYAVVVQNLGVDYNPVTRLGNNMQIDGIHVYGEDWSTLTQLTPGTRHETSYVNRVSDNKFLYYGPTWRSFVGTAARLFSGLNYDSIASFGAGMVFHTNGGNVVRIIRSIRAGYAPLMVCTAPTDDFTPFTCNIVRNDGGTANQQIFNIPLSSTGAHVVSITTLTRGVFIPDAIEVANSTPALTQGIYPETDPRLAYSPINSLTTGWRNLYATALVERGAMQSTADQSSLTFSFQGTGFSLFTLFEVAAGTLNVSIDGTGANDYSHTTEPELVFNNNRSAVLYGSTHSITGLPFDTYTVTITESDTNVKNKFTVDGLQIYGDLPTAMGPGLYDNAAADASNVPFLTFGPTTAWAARSTAGYLNLTNHYSNRHGANVTFEVDNAGYITLFHNLTTSLNLRVCAKTLALNGSGSWTCGTTTTAKNRVNTTISLNNSAADVVLNAGGVGDYLISITNLTHATTFIVDAVQIVGATNLTEGIYQENHPLLSFNNSIGAIPNGGVWAAAPAKIAGTTDGYARSTVVNTAGMTNQNLTFTFDGTGFSIILIEGSTTSGSYEICVTGQIACAPLIRSNNATARTVALTYVGFANATYNVTLRNKDNTKPLIVDRVDVLGALTAGEQIANDITGNVENTDPRITYFPFFTFPTVAHAAAGGSNQSIGSMIGSVAYFELNAFTGSAFDYVRQTLSSYGLVDVCSAAIGTNSHNCTPIETVANNLATPQPFGYQRAESVNVGGGTRWVILRNTNGKPMPLDFIRPTVAGQPLTAGSFEETHPALQYFTETSGTGAGPFVLGGNGNFVDTPLPAASGGSVKLLSADAGSPGNGLYEGVLFQFTGRGFGVKFTLDAKADAVKLCWLSGLTTDVSNVINTGTCTTLDNQSAAARYQASRLIYGLNGGDYTAVVQMLPDNTLPTAHIATALPISMQIDAVQVFNEDWTGLTPLAVGVKTETSFINRVADDRLFYFGNTWKTVAGTAARLYSGLSYDNMANVIGAGVSFRVADASAIVLYRDTRAGYAPIQVCASPEGALTQQFCTTIANNTGTGISQPARVFLSNTPTVGDYIVTISTLYLGIFNLDAIQPVDTTLALLPGLYQNSYPALNYAGGTWTELYATTFSGGTYQQSTDVGATLTFTIDDASGFEVAIPMDRFGGEVEICYDNDGTPADGDCYTYQHERAAASVLVTRTVTGLTVGTQYTVQVKNVENGFTALVTTPNTPRPVTYNPARLRIDYVQVFGEGLPPAVNNPGIYGEGANNGSAPYLQLLPANRWNTFAGTAARGFSDLSYSAVVDNAKRLSALYAGPTATLRVNVPAGGATVILFTGAAVTTNTDQLLVCADVVDSDAGNCTIITNLKLVNQVVLNSTLLTELGNAGNVTLSFRALTPGTFKIDGFQVIHGTTLTPGIYDNYLIGNGGLLDTNGTTWLAPLKTINTYGGTISPASSTNATSDDPTLQFNINGTGFGIMTLADLTGVDLRICYVLTADFDGNFDATGTEKCETVTTDTNTTPADWNTKNDGRNKPVRAYQYTFGYYGLANSNYTVQVRLIDTLLVATDRLRIDAVVVFSDVTNGGAATPLSPGQLYDNTQTSGISYEPGAFWSVVKSVYTPPRGPWLLSDTRATAAGSLLQIYAEGNALVLYQSAGTTNSRRVRVCVSTIDGLDCTEYSQFVGRATFFTPVIFYGLGTTGVHRIYIENRDHGRPVSIDAIRMLE